MSSHPAIVTTAPRAPLTIRHVPTAACGGDEVRVRVDWTSTSLFDLHQVDGGLVVTHGVLGSNFAGIVVEIGIDVHTLSVGIKVFGYGFRGPVERAWQTYVTVPVYMCGEIPSGLASSAAVTVPDSFATAMHSITADLRLSLPWPVPKEPPKGEDMPILLWGAASSAGLMTLQVLVHWGYRNILATASPQHHARLRKLGAAAVFDYRRSECVEDMVAWVRKSGLDERPTVPLILDCIGSLEGSIRPISRLAESGARVAILLPVVVRAPGVSRVPEYAMGVDGLVEFADGVVVEGVRTHTFMENAVLKETIFAKIMPDLMEKKVVRPLERVEVSGETILERAEAALSMMREGVSGKRLVWRVSGEGD